MKKFLSIAAALMLANGAAMAAGDIEAGKTKAAVCGACHGADGNSANADWPKLAGQSAKYLVSQLKAFKKGDRKDPVMAGQVANLSDQDMEDLGAYYASLKVSVGAANPELVETGKKLYNGGNAATGVSACTACHLPTGAGIPTSGYPAIGGQHAAYTAKQLKAFRSGERAKGAAAIMAAIAKGMTDKEIEAVASYVQGLH